MCIDAAIGQKIAALINSRDVAGIMIRAETAKGDEFDAARCARWQTRADDATAALRALGIPAID